MLGLHGVGVVRVLRRWCVLGPLGVVGHEGCKGADRGDVTVCVEAERGTYGDSPTT